MDKTSKVLYQQRISNERQLLFQNLSLEAIYTKQL